MDFRANSAVRGNCTDAMREASWVVEGYIHNRVPTLSCTKGQVPLYYTVYAQRTNCECINSQAKELRIEQSEVRNKRSVAILNTLTYLSINVCALSRAKSINRGLLQVRYLHPSIELHRSFRHSVAWSVD